MKVFKTKSFEQWAKKLKITDSKLKTIITEMEQGLVDANLGQCLYKKRIAVPGRGKSGGTRTIIAYKRTEKAFFIYGFSKNEKENINLKEKEALIKYASILMELNTQHMQQAILGKEIIEVSYE